MDLPYPTIKNSNLSNDLNQLDKLARSILLSTHDLPKQDSLSKSLRNKVLRAVSCDNARKLHQILEKNVIAFATEIGTRGSRWNVLHHCAKNNAHQCTEYILKTQYQQYQDQYKSLVNARTVQGYTILTISIINRSHRVLQRILEYGGIDIHILDEHKMSAYETAINYKNDKAIRLLMSYQSKTKKKQYLNKLQLSKPINFPTQTCCQKITSCLLGCLTFGMYDHNDGFQLDIMKTGRDDSSVNGNKFKGSDYVIEEDAIDYVPINSNKDLRGYDIQWRRVSQLMTGKITIFDSYNPFQIQQTSFTIKHNLILFQCLSQQPWLIRRSLKPDRCRNNHYSISLYPHRLLEKQNIDDHIPYLKDRKEAMFLSNQQEMWPMLLQKGLAKLHGSYFAIAEKDPRGLLEELTGFPTVEIGIDTIKDEELVSYFQEIAAKNYLYVLKGKKGSDLSDEPDKIDCFTILNFYQKNTQQLVLINCPFISQKWKQRERQEPLALKLIKGHYNTHRQMCVWIEAKKMKDYFQSVIVTLCWAGYERAELKVRTREHVFFRFRVENKRDQNLYLQLSNTKNQQVYNLTTLQVIKNQGKQLVQPQQSQTQKYDPTLASLQHSPGEYMCFFQLPPSLSQSQSQDLQSLLLLCWAPEPLQPQYVEPELGVLEWLGFLKNHFLKVDQQCVLEVLGQYSLVLLRENTIKVTGSVLFRMNVESELIIEGRKDEESGFVEMVKMEGNVYYCVVRRVVREEEIVFDYRRGDV